MKNDLWQYHERLVEKYLGAKKVILIKILQSDIIQRDGR